LIFYYKAISDIDPRTTNDNHMSFLSLAWVAEHVMGVAAHVIDQIILNFPESPETIQANIREIAPQIILYNSRLWENLVQTVQDRISDSSWINRLIYKVFLPVGYKVAEAALNEEKVNLWLRILYKIGDFLLYSPVRDKLGLIRVRIALTTGAALSAKVIRFFYAIGIHIRQLYGATEAGIAAMHRENDINFYTVGQVIPGYEIQISTEGEILIHSPAIFNGYHKDQEKSRKAVSIDDDDKCWFKTGDAGALTDKGHLVYYDRMDDMIQLSGGNLYSPQYIEGRLKFNPAIRDVMTLGGNGYSYVTAIITINMETVGRWAEKSGIPYTTFLDLSQKAEVYDMLDDAIKEVNRNLAPPARVKRFVSLHKEFDADEGEITRTRKLRRNFLQDRYGKIIEAMYDEYNSVEVDASVQYRDGRTSSVEAKLRIATIETEENDQP
jgi:long-chain acyl-CoA synthetase